ncbi:MAG: AtpZ/AtpI family protein [Thermacetogeniaceae bacterium]
MAKKKGSTGWRALNLATTLGITLAASVFLGYYIGHYLDMWILHNPKTPWFTFIFSLLGIAAGFRGVFRLINESVEDGGKE